MTSLFDQVPDIHHRNIHLRKITAADTADMQKLFPYPLSMQQTVHMMAGFEACIQNRTAMILAVAYGEDDNAVGVIELYQKRNACMEIGYRIRKEYRGRGLCGQSTEALMKYLEKTDIQYITASVSIDNGASCHILINNEFKQVDSRDGTLYFVRKIRHGEQGDHYAEKHI